MDTFAEKLRTVRKERNYTQEMLSNEMNVSRQTISHWENGRAVPDINTIKRLSQVLKYNFLALEEPEDGGQSAPEETEVPVQQEAAREQKAAPRKKKMLACLIGAVLLCAVLTGGFVIGRKRQQPAAANESPALQANVVITPVENPLPLIAVDDFPEGYGWLYEVVIEETAGVPFTASTLTQAIIDEDGMEYPNSFVVDHIIPAWGGDTLYKDAPRSWRGGIPLQPVKAIRVILCGTDANGNEVKAECTIELLKQTAE